jgi:rhodanese-related sulfurtransferase
MSTDGAGARQGTPPSPGRESNPAPPARDATRLKVMEVKPTEVRKLIGDGAQLVDVRAEHEWEAGRIEGAVHLPLAELSGRVGELDRDRSVVVYCLGDNRAEMAAEALGSAGFDASPLAGGIRAWAEAGLPLEPEAGYVAESGEAAAILAARRKPAQS